MCILCTSRIWCRRAAAVLPWLVVPLSALWALSALLLPPRMRIEITPHRLAGALVLLGTLSWYEIVLPRLSLWRAHHSARRRDRHLTEAIEMEKLRKTAVRKCRNCQTVYRDQNPTVGSRFTCSNCGHVSKRPMYDGGSSGQVNGFICNQDWWVELFSAENACKVFVSGVGYTRRAWTKVAGVVSWKEDHTNGKDVSVGKGDGGESVAESRSERAKRKAEEKRQARLEKEMLETEEQKQREEVARLVEERRKLRDEVQEAEKESLRRSASVGKKEKKKGGERKRHESGKEKDKGSSKSNSDCEEIEKRVIREREGKQTFDKRIESEKKTPMKNAALDRTKVPYVSSPRSFKALASGIKSNKPVNGFEHGQSSVSKKGAQSAANFNAKSSLNGDDRRNATNVPRPMESNFQPRVPAPKRSWLQLFTRSSAVSPCSDADSSPLQTENAPIADPRMSPDYSLYKPCNSGQVLPLTGFPPMPYPPGTVPAPQLAGNYGSPSFKGPRQGLVSEEADIFEDPCFVPEPVRFFAPVSQSLDNLPLGPGLGYVVNESRLAKKGLVPEVSKPSPIGAPLSRLRVSREGCSVPGQLSNRMLGSNMDEPGTWQMWGSPLVGEGLVGGTNWLSNTGVKSSQEDVMNFSPHKPLVPHTVKENSFLLGRQVPQSIPMGSYQNGGMGGPLRQIPEVNDLLAQRSLFHTLPTDGDTCSFPLNQMDKLLLTEVGCDTPNGSASSENSESSAANYWSKRGCTSHGLEDVGYSAIDVPYIQAPFAANHDVQPLWSFN